MKKIILLLSFVVYTFAFFGNNKLYFIWMNNGTHTMKEKGFAKIVNRVEKKLEEDYDVEFKSLNNYESLYSLIDNPKYYVNQDKLRTGLLSDQNVFNKDGYYVLFKIIQKGDVFYIKGVKFKKDGMDGPIIRYVLKKKITKHISLTLYNMIYFFVKSGIVNYKEVDRKGVKPFMVDKNGKLNVVTFTHQKVMLFNKPVSSDDIDLVKKLNLISAKSDAEFARKYCRFLNMYLANKIYINPSDEYYFEEYYEQNDFRDGYKIFKPIMPIYDTDKDFRCIGNDYTLIQEPLSDYELNNLGIRWKIKSPFFIKVGDVQATKNGVKVVLLDDKGHLEIYHNNTKIDSDNFYDSYHNVESLKIEGKNDYKITAFNKILEYSNQTLTSNYIKNHYIKHRYYVQYQNSDNYINLQHKLYYKSKEVNLNFKVTTFLNLYENGNMIVGGENGNLVTISGDKNYKIVHYKGLKGNIVKMLMIKNNLAVITSLGEFAIYKLGVTSPIKLIPQIGYAYSDMSLSKDGKYLLLINLNQRAYVFLTKVLLKNGSK